MMYYPPTCQRVAVIQINSDDSETDSERNRISTIDSVIEIDSEIDSERNRNVQSKGIEASYLPFRGGWFDGVVNRKGSPFPIPFPRDWRGLV